MKAFKVPEVEFVRWSKMSIFTANSCEPCPGCEPGANDCKCEDYFETNEASGNSIPGSESM